QVHQITSSNPSVMRTDGLCWLSDRLAAAPPDEASEQSSDEQVAICRAELETEDVLEHRDFSRPCFDMYRQRVQAGPRTWADAVTNVIPFGGHVLLCGAPRSARSYRPWCSRSNELIEKPVSQLPTFSVSQAVNSVDGPHRAHRNRRRSSCSLISSTSRACTALMRHIDLATRRRTSRSTS